MREHDRLFKFYCQETNPTVKLTKHNERIEKTVLSNLFSKKFKKISKKLGMVKNRL